MRPLTFALTFVWRTLVFTLQVLLLTTRILSLMVLVLLAPTTYLIVWALRPPKRRWSA